jgi:hypothetical protein
MTPADDPNRVRVSIDDEQTPSVAVVDAVAALTDTEPTDCPPLYDRVNPDAVDALFADRDGGQFTFEYHECQVTVHGDTEVTVTLRE